MQKTTTSERPAQTQLTDTEQAVKSFEAMVQDIPGVLATRVRGENLPTTKTFVVTVPSLFSEEARRVVALRSRLFRKFPKAHLDVHIEGVREGGVLPEKN